MAKWLSVNKDISFQRRGGSFWFDQTGREITGPTPFRLLFVRNVTEIVYPIQRNISSIKKFDL